MEQRAPNNRTLTLTEQETKFCVSCAAHLKPPVASIILASKGPDRINIVSHNEKTEIIEVSSSLGVADARRKGFLASRGEYIAYFKSLADYVEEIRGHEDLVLIAPHSDYLEDLDLGLVVRKIRGMNLGYLFFHRRLYEASGTWCAPEISKGEDWVLKVALLSHVQTKSWLMQRYILQDHELSEASLDSKEDADSYILAIEEVEGYLRRHGLLEKVQRQLDYTKMQLKNRIFKSLGSKGYKHLFKETDPSVLEGSKISFFYKLRLVRSR